MSNPVIPLNIPNARIRIADREGVMAQHIARFITDVTRRLGGQREDFIQTARSTALESQAMVLAILKGITTGYSQSPSQPLSYAPATTTTADIAIAQHTRSTAAATIIAGTVAGVTRGSVYYVYYDDAGNAGGAVTFHATTDVTILTAAGRRIVGAVHVDNVSPSGGTAGET